LGVETNKGYIRGTGSEKEKHIILSKIKMNFDNRISISDN
jgi:hypothetical protein